MSCCSQFDIAAEIDCMFFEYAGYHGQLTSHVFFPRCTTHGLQLADSNFGSTADFLAAISSGWKLQSVCNAWGVLPPLTLTFSVARLSPRAFAAIKQLGARCKRHRLQLLYRCFLSGTIHQRSALLSYPVEAMSAP